MAVKRLQYEYMKFQQEPSNSPIRAGPLDESDLYRWWATIEGPEATPFQGGVFEIIIDYSTEYPFKPPKMRFETKIFHPNVSRRGTICVDILQKQWSPALTTSKVLLSICSLLASPNPADPMDAESADLYLENPELYFKRAKQWTEKYAVNNTAHCRDTSVAIPSHKQARVVYRPAACHSANEWATG